MKNKVELLAPAGSLEKMKYAYHFGADAVYLGVPDFSLRVRINRFSDQDIKEAVKYARSIGKKIYVTLNIYAHNRHLDKIKKHLKFLRPLGIDAVIVSDPGIINLVKKYLPSVDIHLSTQANATNAEAIKFWRDAGVKRIILARELSLQEIKEIRKNVKNIELEVFVHGAMCMSYSGRCILSKWMTGRSANLGDCSQPCRWGYKIQTQSSKLKGQSCGVPIDIGTDFLKMSAKDDLERFDVDLEEDKHGTYFFNSYDLNLIEYVKDLIEAGVSSLKIEGRAKSAYYVSSVCRAYRKAIDDAKNSKNYKRTILEQKKELEKLTHRGYWTGFLLGDEPPHNFSGKIKKGEWEFVGEVLDFESGLNSVKVHNAIYLNDKVEAATPNGNIKIKIKKIMDDRKREVKGAHGGHDKIYYFEFSKKLPAMALIRKIVQ